MIDIDAPTFPWIGTALRHMRSGKGRDPLDFTFAGTNRVNRWNKVGHSTLYLAGDPGVLVAEWGRAFPLNFDHTESTHRDVYRYSFKFESVINLTDASIRALFDLGMPGSSGILDKNVSRSTADQVRRRTNAQAMLVPSVAFLDDPSRWNLVVFLEKVSADTALWITDVTRVGPHRWK